MNVASYHMPPLPSINQAFGDCYSVLPNRTSSSDSVWAIDDLVLGAMCRLGERSAPRVAHTQSEHRPQRQWAVVQMGTYKCVEQCGEHRTTIVPANPEING
jgi:hypothetical protein